MHPEALVCRLSSHPCKATDNGGWELLWDRPRAQVMQWKGHLRPRWCPRTEQGTAQAWTRSNVLCENYARRAWGPAGQRDQAPLDNTTRVRSYRVGVTLGEVGRECKGCEWDGSPPWHRTQASVPCRGGGCPCADPRDPSLLTEASQAAPGHCTEISP